MNNQPPPPPQLSVVIPAYNEERRLPATLRSMLHYLRAHEPSWEIVVVDDGSSDATAAQVAAIAQGEPRLRLHHLPANRGKGFAVRTGVLASRGRHVLICDADLSTPMAELPRLRSALDGGARAAIGSRACAGARVEVRQHPIRELAGRLGNWLIRALAVPEYADTQCGFKLFDGHSARMVFSLARLDGWCSDVEILYLFGCLRLRVVEVPVRWADQPGSKVRPQDYLRGLVDVLRIRWS